MAYSLTKERPSEAMDKLLRDTASGDERIARAAARELAKALTLPLKQGVLKGDIIGGIYETIKFNPGEAVEFPLDFLTPGTEKDHIAFTIPNVGALPERRIDGDYLMVPTYYVGNTISWSLRYAEHARWDVVYRAMQVLEAGHIRKNNNDGWRTLISAAAARNLVVYDDAAPAGLFTKRVVSLMKTVMRRNAGGNSTSTNHGRLTDLYLSPEGLEDIRSWDMTQIDEVTRREIFLSDGETTLTRIFGVTLHDIDELGVGQEYQQYYTSTLGGSLQSDKVELMVGLDLRNRDSFVRPVRKEVEVWEDMTMHRANLAGVYSRGEGGWGVQDGRRVLLGSF